VRRWPFAVDDVSDGPGEPAREVGELGFAAELEIT